LPVTISLCQPRPHPHSTIDAVPVCRASATGNRQVDGGIPAPDGRFLRPTGAISTRTSDDTTS
jgi:hypothetical protein